MVRWCWVNFQCRGVLLIWIIVGQGPIALAVGAGGGCLDIFFSFLSPSLWETARYRLKYCLKVPLSPRQSINQSILIRTVTAVATFLTVLKSDTASTAITARHVCPSRPPALSRVRPVLSMVAVAAGNMV